MKVLKARASETRFDIRSYICADQPQQRRRTIPEEHGLGHTRRPLETTVHEEAESKMTGAGSSQDTTPGRAEWARATRTMRLWLANYAKKPC